MDTQTLLSRLAHIPTQIEDALAGWSNEQLRAPQAAEWSAVDIFAHVRASDEIMTYRLYALLVREQATFPAFDDRAWAERMGFAASDFRTSLHLFSLRRAELMHTLSRIEAAGWQRSAVHEVNGAFTLLEAVTRLVEHEEEHCRQLAALRA